MLKAGVCVHSAHAMQALGRGVVRELFGRSGGVLALQGDLGAGKTTLVRGIAEALGAGEITSPSFNYYLMYKEGKRPLIHVDAYRLKGPADWDGLMLNELLTPQTLLVVEWPERVREALPEGTRWLQLSGGDERQPEVREVKMR